MSKNVIFCYSGSGNCLDIAKNIAKRLGDTDIVMMRAEPEVKDVRGAKRVGFVFPCYAGGLPGDVEKFVSELRVDPESYTFGVVCYAGYPGVGMAKIHDIVPLDYWAGITHQCSCIWLMPHNLMLPPARCGEGTGALREAGGEDRGRHSLCQAPQRTPAVEPRERPRSKGMADALGQESRKDDRDRQLRRLRPVRKALPTREYQHSQWQGKHRHELYRLPELPAVLPEAGDKHGRRDRQARALP